MRKGMLVFGTRAEAVKLCPLVRELRNGRGLWKGSGTEKNGLRIDRNRKWEYAGTGKSVTAYFMETGNIM